MPHFQWRIVCSSLVVALGTACAGSTLTNQHPQIAAAPPALDFGTVSTLAAVSQPITLTNTGTGTLDLDSVVVSQDAAHAFAVQNVPTKLGAGASAALTIVMTPPAEDGLYGASLLVTSNASNAPQLLVQLSVRVNLSSDAGSMDAGHHDGGSDAGAGDAGAMDAGAPDSGSDAGPVDAGPDDAGSADAGPDDAGSDDAGPDAGPVDAGCPSGLTMCTAGCKDTTSDQNNCGMCGNNCGNENNTGCVNSHCVACAPTAGYITLASGQGQPTDLAVDGTDVYWTAQTDQTVVKVGLDGGTPVTLASATEAEFASLFALDPENIAVDPSGVYFTSQYEDTVLKVPLTGGLTATIGGMQAQSWPSKLALDANSVYWLTTTTGAVMKDKLYGGTPTTLAAAPTNPNGQFEMIGVDSANVYWMARGTPGSNDTAIMKVGIDGGTPAPVASNLYYATSGAVDSTYVYWADSVEGTVVKALSSGSGTPITLASGLDGPRNLVIDATNAYWSAGGTDGSLMSCSGTVQSVPLSGGPVVNLVYGQYSAYAVRVDQSYLYWTDLFYGTIMKTPLP